ncbi:hypothetical protein [Natronomonas sp. EA1]|uniref:hypothetical protein n=1 Tax=Natronomonas sp. EA1 TaxID=3421655 RepID=UPI003EB91FE3
MTDTLALEHDLPDDLRDACSDDSRSIGALYNTLQSLSDEQFAARFEDSLDTVREVCAEAPDIPLLAVVLGLTVADAESIEDGPLVGDAAVITAHIPGVDGGVADLRYCDPDATALDYFLFLPLRPEDCPPGTGEPASDLSMEEYREIVSAMCYQRFNLLQNDVDAYTENYMRPLVRGLEAFAERR